MWKKLYEWLDERLGLGGLYRNLLDRPEPRGTWWNTLGSASLFLFILQGVTGIFLTVYYTPSPDHAYDSITYIMNGVAFGWLIRGIHHWGATLMVLVVFIHMLPWNQKSYWATTVGTSIAGTMPFVGEFILKVLRGGPDLSALTLARFFSAHIWMIPAAITGLIGLHLYLIIRHGESHFPTKQD